ncbi:polysaccharide pyruvyl transferase family protein [Collinsella sp. SGI.184]|uniref:polysaccharide pyruvyl transferase family protein n=1 Tax=Collinsella sp. SGI.184 TaxID=3420556 RepID=UPI003CFDDC8B
MKIGILTFQRAYNYGASLQAYALSKALKGSSEDIEVSVLDYRTDKLNDAAKLIKSGEGLSAKTAAKIGFRLLKHRSFNTFDKRYLSLTAPIRDWKVFAGTNSQFDALVVGSDQVWKDDITGSDPAFYLEGIKSDIPRYSYAASFAGSEEVGAQVLKNHRSELEKFETVSLRENGYLSNFAEQLSSPVRRDLDPVLLLSQNQWAEVASPRLIKDKYAFMYVVGPEINIRKFAESYCKKYGLKLIDNKKSIEFLKHCSPEDFLSWIQNADCLITNSFHGTAFSVIFQKTAFYELGQGEKRNFRAASLLDSVGISGREIVSDVYSDGEAVVDWALACSKLDAMRENSLSYVKAIAEGRSGADTSGIKCSDAGSNCSNNPAAQLPRYYVGAHGDIEICKHSSSGGAFTALTDAFFSRHNNSVIYGCAWNENLEAVHIRAVDESGRNAMRGSKYIPSKLGDSFKHVADDLRHGRNVVFSGTPCNIAALNKYIAMNGVPTDRLLTISFLCHGVGSERFFRDYIAHLEDRYGGHAIAVNFRAKSQVGKIQDMRVEFDNGKVYTAASTNSDWFYSIYLANLILRPSCYKCKFAGGARPSDIDIADAWGQPWIDGKAPSLLISNTEKGQTLIDDVTGVMSLRELPYSRVKQPAMIHHAEKPLQYDEFWRVYNEEGYLSAQRLFGNNTIWGKARAAAIRVVDVLGVRKLLKR